MDRYMQCRIKLRMLFLSFTMKNGNGHEKKPYNSIKYQTFSLALHEPPAMRLQGLFRNYTHVLHVNKLLKRCSHQKCQETPSVPSDVVVVCFQHWRQEKRPRIQSLAVTSTMQPHFPPPNSCGILGQTSGGGLFASLMVMPSSYLKISSYIVMNL